MDAGELLMMVSGNKVKKRQAERAAATQQRVQQQGPDARPRGCCKKCLLDPYLQTLLAGITVFPVPIQEISPVLVGVFYSHLWGRSLVRPSLGSLDYL